KPGEGLPGRVWQSGEPNWINELAKDTNFPRLGVAAKNQLQSAFAFPILLGSEVIGVGEFFSRQMRERDDEMLEMLAGIGSDIGQPVRSTSHGRRSSCPACTGAAAKFRWNCRSVNSCKTNGVTLPASSGT